MNFLKSVLSSSGGLPGYSLQEKIDVSPYNIFTLHNATKKDDNSVCSILTFEVSKAPTLLPLARNYHSKLRSLKHPGVVKFLDSLENDSYIYIATERIEPLHYTLLKNPDRDFINWGLYSVAKTVAFINGEAASIHGNLRVSSFFTTESGEWKVAGFEALTCMKDDEHFITRYGGMVPDIYAITPPELQQKGFSELKTSSTTSLDAYQFACFVHACYGSQGSLQTQGKIPNNMFAQYRRLISLSPSARLSVSSFLDFGRRPDLFFRNDLISISEQIPDLPLKSKQEVEDFLSENQKTFAKLPSGFTKNRLLPEMIKSLEFGGGGSTALNAVLTVTKDLSPSDIELLIVPMILRVWTSKDRATHLVMLEHLNDYISFLTPKQINDKLFPCISGVFSDHAPIMRETAIRQVMILTPHLSDRNINGDLLKCLAKTANDLQPGIRTNTTICLGKIASSLGGSKRKVLTAAFSRSLKDPFLHARTAALQAISATSDVYEKDDLALRLMPGVIALLIDAEKSVRDQARKCLNELLGKLDLLTRDMPETIIAVTNNSNKEKTALESAGVWAGWAVSSLSRNVDSPAPSVPASTAASVASSRAATPAASNPSSLSPNSNHNTDTNHTRSSRKGLKLERKSTKVDVEALYEVDGYTNGGGGQTPDLDDAWGTEWDDTPASPKSPQSAPATASVSQAARPQTQAQPARTSSNGLAKPLAKSRAPITKVVPKTGPAVPVKDAVQTDTQGEEEWDTDAW